MPDPRTTTLDDLNQFDIGCRVTFKRPASEDSGRPVITGNLVAFATAQYVRGNMPRLGYTVTVEYAGRYSWSPNSDTFGPLPASYPITVGGAWHHKPDPIWDEPLTDD